MALTFLSSLLYFVQITLMISTKSRFQPFCRSFGAHFKYILTPAYTRVQSQMQTEPEMYLWYNAMTPVVDITFWIETDTFEEIGSRPFSRLQFTDKPHSSTYQTTFRSFEEFSVRLVAVGGEGGGWKFQESTWYTRGPVFHILNRESFHSLRKKTTSWARTTETYSEPIASRIHQYLGFLNTFTLIDILYPTCFAGIWHQTL